MKWTALALLGLVQVASADDCTGLKLTMYTSGDCSGEAMTSLAMTTEQLALMNSQCTTAGLVSTLAAVPATMSTMANGAKTVCDANGISWTTYDSVGCAGSVAETGTTPWGVCKPYGEATLGM